MHLIQQFELVCFARRDVSLGSGNAAGLPIGVTNGDPPDQHPLSGAFPLPHAAFDLDLGAFPFQVRGDGRLKAVGSFPRQAFVPFLRVGAHLVLTAAEHGFQSGRQIHGVRREIPVPQSVIGALGGPPVALPAQV